jgi:hypothetical protein
VFFLFVFIKRGNTNFGVEIKNIIKKIENKGGLFFVTI